MLRGPSPPYRWVLKRDDLVIQVLVAFPLTSVIVNLAWSVLANI